MSHSTYDMGGLFLTKPFEPQRLLASVEAVLPRRP